MITHDGEMGRWLESLGNELGCDAADLLFEAAQPLVSFYCVCWNGDPERNGRDGVTSYERRLAATLQYHWWRFCQLAYRPLDEVVELLQSGRLSYGRFPSDVLRDVALAEGVCQRDAGATECFLAEFSSIISTAALQAGGARARQDLEGFEADLMIPRDNQQLPRLARFSGHTPLRNWLQRVVHNQWRSRMRCQREHTSSDKPENVDRTPGPTESAQDYECLNVLRPIFEGSADMLDSEEALLLRMVLLDGVPQQDLAQLWGVHKSTITRNRQKTCRKLVDRFWELAESYGQQSEYKDCVEWISAASPRMWLTLGNYIAEGIRRT